MLYNFVNKYFEKHSQSLLFLSFFFIFLTCGLYFTFFNNAILTQYDLVFDADSPRVLGDFLIIQFNHYRVKVHPLLLITLQPIFHFFNAFVQSTIATTLIVQSVVSAINVCLIKSILYKFTENKKIAFFFALIFGFSFSTLIFTITPENYIFGTLISLLLFYYISHLALSETMLSKKSIFILSFLSVLAFGIIPILAFQNIILVIWLLLKKINSSKELTKKLLSFFVIFLSLFISLSLIQKISYPDTPIFFKEAVKEDIDYTDFSFNKKKITNLANGLYVQSFYATKIILTHYESTGQDYILFAEKQNFVRYIPIILFLGSLCIYYAANYKRNKNNSLIFSLFAVSIINFCFYYFYANGSCFLFTQNFFAHFIIMLGLMLSTIKSDSAKKIFTLMCGLFLIYQIIANFNGIRNVVSLLSDYVSKHYNILTYILYSLISVLFMIILFGGIKKFAKTEITNMNIGQKYFAYSIAYLIYMIICALFIAIFHARGF